MFEGPTDCLLAWQLQIAELRKTRYNNKVVTSISLGSKAYVKHYMIEGCSSKASNTDADTPKYSLRATPTDGDCFFHAVRKPGFDRAALIKKLLENSQNPIVLKAFAIEIRQFLYIACIGGHENRMDQLVGEKILKEVGEFKELLKNLDKAEYESRQITALARVKLGIENTKGKLPSEILQLLMTRRINILTEFKKHYDAVEEVNQEIIRLCQKPEVFNSYIKHYLDEGKGFIPFARDFKGDKEKNVIDIINALFDYNIQVCMFNEKRDGLTTVVNENPVDPSNIIRIFHNGIDHFMGVEADNVKSSIDVKTNADNKMKIGISDSRTSAEATGNLGQISTLPGYVLNIPLHVDSDNDCSSDESPIDEKEKFTNHKHYFAFDDNAPPFRLKGSAKRKARGIINMGSIIHSETPAKNASGDNRDGTTATTTTAAIANDTKVQKDKTTIKLDQLTEIFQTQSFTKTSEGSKIEADKRLRIIIGLNRRESLIKKRNRKLNLILNSPEGNPELVHKLGFLWQPIYKEILPKNAKPKNTKIPEATFHRVRMWYKKLKEINPEKAKIFREKVERTDVTREMVPYREIRETIKNDSATIKQVRSLRQSGAVDPNKIYLGIFDSDTKALRSASNPLGTFGQYDNMILTIKRPFVLSTGYRVCDEASELTKFAVTLDMAIRYTTTQFIANGIYYPEPNLLIQVEPSEDTVIESFNTTDEDYNSPIESKVILKHILQNRKLDFCTDFHFSNISPVITETPDRFELSLTKKNKDSLKVVQTAHERKKLMESMRKVYSGYFNNQNKIYLWCRKDLDHIRSVSQSHFNNLKWAHNIWDAVADNFNEGLSEKMNTLSGEQVTAKSLRDMVVSLISRMFNCFDPLTMAKNHPSTEFDNFLDKLSDVIENYSKITSFQSFSSSKTKRVTEKNTKTWEILDKANTSIELEAVLAELISDPKLSNKICVAAKSVGVTIQKVFQQNLCLNFFEIIRLTLDCYMQQFMHESTSDDYSSTDDIEDSSENDDSETRKTLEDLPIHVAILENTLCGSHNAANKKDALTEKEIKKNLHAKGNYGLRPLHYAAVTGNVRLIRYLKSLGARIDQTANGNVLPLHLAILFCGQQGCNPELISELATPDLIESSVTTGQTPLLLAISTGNDLNTIEALIKEKADINNTNEDDSTSVLHECLYSYLERKRDLIESRELLEFLLEEGADYTIDNTEDGTPFNLALYFKIDWAIQTLLQFSAIKLEINLESLSRPSIMQSGESPGENSESGKNQDLANDLLRKEDFSVDEAEVIREMTGYHIYCNDEEEEIESGELEEAIRSVLSRQDSKKRIASENVDADDLRTEIYNELVADGVDWEVLNERGIAIPEDFYETENSSSSSDDESGLDKEEGLSTRVERYRGDEDDAGDDADGSDSSSDSDVNSNDGDQPQNPEGTDSGTEIDYPTSEENSSSDFDSDSNSGAEGSDDSEASEASKASEASEASNSEAPDLDSKPAPKLLLKTRALKRKWSVLQSTSDHTHDGVAEDNNQSPKAKRIKARVIPKPITFSVANPDVANPKQTYSIENRNGSTQSL